MDVKRQYYVCFFILLIIIIMCNCRSFFWDVEDFKDWKLHGAAEEESASWALKYILLHIIITFEVNYKLERIEKIMSWVQRIIHRFPRKCNNKKSQTICIHTSHSVIFLLGSFYLSKIREQNNSKWFREKFF